MSPSTSQVVSYQFLPRASFALTKFETSIGFIPHWLGTKHLCFSFHVGWVPNFLPKGNKTGARGPPISPPFCPLFYFQLHILCFHISTHVATICCHIIFFRARRENTVERSNYNIFFSAAQHGNNVVKKIISTQRRVNKSQFTTL